MIIVSFFLSLLVYVAIIFMLLNFLITKPKKEKEVLIHTAIIPSKIEAPKKTPKKSVKVKQKSSQKPKPKPKKKKIGSKKNVTTGGSVSLEDIFKNVKENVDTTKIKRAKNLEMSRFKGLERIEKNLKKVKSLNVDISVSSSGGKKADIDKVIQKISEIWDEISYIAGEYAKIEVINQNGNVDVIILDSNLDEARQAELINRIKSLKLKGNFTLNIKFQTKVNK